MFQLLPTLAVLIQTSVAGCGTMAERPLFECDTPLAIELTLPMRTLMRNAKRHPVLDGTLRFADSRGQDVILDVKVTTRGHDRLQNCNFPPLSLTVDPQQARDTTFAGQKKLKIVTQCKRGAKYLDFLRQEFGIYKAFNALSEFSFRVRMLSITFLDSAGKRREDVQVAFFIESVPEVGQRLGLRTVKQNQIGVWQLDAKHANVYEVFQFMIANTDWSMFKGPGEEDCCHNGKVFGAQGTDTDWLLLPYDFDRAGLIDAPYAEPDARLPIRSVRQRLFRGHCHYLGHLERTIQLFNDRRDAIESAINTGGVTEKTISKQTDYIAEFYTIINDPEKLQRQIVASCRGGKSET